MPYYSNRYYSRASQLGDLYDRKLNLQPKEVTWLNKFYAPVHAFVQIEVARKAAVRLFVAVVNELETRCKAAGSTLAKRVKELVEAAAPHEYANYNPNYGYSYNDRSSLYRSDAGHKVGAAVFLTIFHRCENAVRERFGYKLFDADVYFSERNDPERLFNEYFGDVTQALLYKLARALPLPDAELELALNQADPERWKSRFERLLAHLPANPAEFLAGVSALGQENERNPKAETIYLEATRHLSVLDREAYLQLYLHYLNCGGRRYGFKPKPLLKRVQKALFPLPEHLTRFEALCQKLLHDRDLTAATVAVPGIYYKERKKIALDPAAVQTARAQHSGTVELLNEYLRDAPEEPAALPAPAAPAAAKVAKPAKPAPAKPIKKAPATAAAKAPKAARAASAAAAAPGQFASSLDLTAVEQQLLQLFAQHQLTLPQTTVEAFARQHGALRNQLIDGLNERCYELLDDVLLEESGDNYTIYAPYFQKVSR